MCQPGEISIIEGEKDEPFFFDHFKGFGDLIMKMNKIVDFVFYIELNDFSVIPSSLSLQLKHSFAFDS